MGSEPSFTNINKAQSIQRAPASRVKQIWAVGGGKGGVGKSLLTSSMAIALARLGNKVTAIDLDLGGANLHTALGVDLPTQTLSDFVSNRVSSLESCSIATSIQGLHIISGAQDSVNIAQIPQAFRNRILENLHTLDTDYVILDLGAGTSDSTMDFFLYADIGVVALLPEPTSIENAYRFIKSAYFRRLRGNPQLASIHSLIDIAMDGKNARGIRSPSDLFREVNRLDPEAAIKLKREIDSFNPKLIINQARTQTDIDIGFSIKTVCKKYFGIEMDYLGSLDYDSAVWQSVRRKRPVLLEFPNSRLVSNIERMTMFLLKRYGHVRNDHYK